MKKQATLKKTALYQNCRHFQYCPNGTICHKTTKVQNSFEFL